MSSLLFLALYFVSNANGIAHSTNMNYCTISCPLNLHVYPNFKNNIVLARNAFMNVHDAFKLLRKCSSYPVCKAIVWLHPGIHTLNGIPLVLDGGIGSFPIEFRAVKNHIALLSGGELVTGWNQSSPGHWVASLSGIPGAKNPKSLRIGAKRVPQVTFPSTGHPLPKNRYLYARHVVELNSTTYHVSFDDKVMPKGWNNWTNIVSYIFPGNSWVGLRVVAKPDPRKTPDGQARFLFHCLDGFSGLEVGNRVSFAGDPLLLTTNHTNGIWAVDSESKLHMLSHGMPKDVYVPIIDRLVTIEGRTNVSINGLTLVDTNFIASGVQTGFNERDEDPGIPHDAAIHISRSTHVSILNCDFQALGGGGVIVGNMSKDVIVAKSNFESMGQSAIIFVGNSTTQATNGTIINNIITGVGEILASAGGIVLSSASNVYIGWNNITGSSRWGIAVRSNHNASSSDNIIEYNRVLDTGLLTADFGAISLIDHTAQHNVKGNIVRGNCVKNVIGMRDAEFRHKFGELLVNFWGRGVYLDDHTSNVEIYKNIFVGASHAGIFVHSGSNNTIKNNIFYNSTDMSILLKTITKIPGYMYNNTITHNAFIERKFPPPGSDTKPPPFLAGPLGSPIKKALMEVNHNLFYSGKTTNIKHPLYTNLFIGKNWTGWLNENYGNDSLANVSPGFVSYHNWTLEKDSPLHDLGFDPLDLTIC